MSETGFLKEWAKFNLRAFPRVIVIVLALLITHELGHMISYLILGIPFEVIFLEQGTHAGVNYGTVIGFSRPYWTKQDFLTELWIKMFFPVIFNLLTLALIRYCVRFLVRGDALPAKYYLIIIPALLIGDILILLQDISLGII